MDRNARPLNEVVEMLLPTPNTTDWNGSGKTQGRARDGKLRTAGDADLPEAVALLPTPTCPAPHDSQHSSGTYRTRRPGYGLELPNAVIDLLSPGEPTSLLSE